MAIRDVVTAGWSNGTFTSSIKYVVTRGYDISTVIPPTVPGAPGIVGAGSAGIGIKGVGSSGSGIIGTGSTGGIKGGGSL